MSRKIRSAIEIDDELAKLQYILNNLTVVQSAFGDDHYSAVEAQCAVLADSMSSNDIYDTWGDEEADEFAQNVLDEALAAADWLWGEFDDLPSAGWDGMYKPTSEVKA